MAALTVRAVKLAVFSGAAVPLIGYSGRLSAQSMDGSFDEEKSKPIRACDIPMYPMANKIPEPVKQEPKPEPNVVQKQITNFRIFSTDVYKQVMNGYEAVKDKTMIGVEHSRSALDYVQTNPGELPRVGVITMASLGGFVIGFRRSALRKVVYATIAGLSATALCYPNHAVDLSRAISEDCKRLWKENIGWPYSDDESKQSKPAPKVPMESQVIKVLTLKGDHGQSKSEDKDLYSSRSS